MESKLKAQAMESVGELPNLLLREGGYPHLLLAKELIWSSDAKPKKVGVYKVRSESHPEAIRFAHWSGLAFGKFGTDIKSAIEGRNLHSSITDIQWNIKESVQVPEPQLTVWFDGAKQNPFHAGSYETAYGEDLSYKAFQYWDGFFWGRCSEDAVEAMRISAIGLDQNPMWRGLDIEVQP